jgi:O-antigen/teichoic acid export membrane protein
VKTIPEAIAAVCILAIFIGFAVVANEAVSDLMTDGLRPIADYFRLLLFFGAPFTATFVVSVILIRRKK